MILKIERENYGLFRVETKIKSDEENIYTFSILSAKILKKIQVFLYENKVFNIF